jgi:hypothetical protein
MVPSPKTTVVILPTAEVAQYKDRRGTYIIARIHSLTDQADLPESHPRK